MTSENTDGAALERDTDSAEEKAPRAPVDIGEVRDLLHDFAILMRAEEKQIVPKDEPDPGSRSGLRRKAESTQYRALRPIRMRGDRLLADLGELTAALADRVVALEIEVKRLQAESGDDG